MIIEFSNHMENFNFVQFSYDFCTFELFVRSSHSCLVRFLHPLHIFCSISTLNGTISSFISLKGALKGFKTSLEVHFCHISGLVYPFTVWNWSKSNRRKFIITHYKKLLKPKLLLITLKYLGWPQLLRYSITVTGS